jgi:serine/threonine-protein kinase
VLEPEQIIAGRYRLESPIGEGAMAAVWRAEDQTLKRQVAIKFLFVKGTKDPQVMVDQFLREARIAASVQHRNVIHTVDFGTMGDSQPFMVMELLSGESLGDRLAREPRLSGEQVVHLVSLTLRGLAAVHDAGIVHRDLKPHNIFLQRDADAVYPKILDFGISRSLQQRTERPSAIATQAGMIVGTPDYMAPEQARGEGDIDARADIYSMGVILYEGLTGRLPFDADTIGDLIVKIVTEEPPRAHEVAPGLPRAMSEMIAQAMAKDREHRFADARAMRRALLAAAEHALPVAAPSPIAQPSVSLSPSSASSALDVAAGGSTWGDFEGLDSPQMRDRPATGPSAAGASIPGPSKRRIAARADSADLEPPPAPVALPKIGTIPSMELDVEPAQPRGRAPAGGPAPRGVGPGPAGARPVSPAAPRNGGASGRSRRRPPGGARKRPRRPTPGPGRPSGSPGGGPGGDPFDALYGSNEGGSVDLDYDRIRAADRRVKPRQRPIRRVPGRAEITPRRSYGAYVLPLIALALLGWFMLRPSLGGVLGGEGARISLGGGSLADSDFKSMRVRTPQRRSDPRSAPVHMRDVVFE